MNRKRELELAVIHLARQWRQAVEDATINGNGGRWQTVLDLQEQLARALDELDQLEKEAPPRAKATTDE